LRVRIGDRRHRGVRFRGEFILERKTGGRRLALKPFERKLRERIAEAAAADIGVGADKPSLLGPFDRSRGCVDCTLVGPQRRHEGLAVLVDRQGMEGIFVIVAKPGIQERIGFSFEAAIDRKGNAERAYGIEYADELDRDRLGIFQHPAFFKAELVGAALSCDQLPNSFLLRAPVALEQLVDAERRATLQQAAFQNEARQASRRVGAAAEAENENLVAGRIVLHQPFVGTGDRGIDSAAEHSSTNFFAELGAEAGAVIGALLASVRACRREQRAQPPDVRVVAHLVPGAVQEQRKALFLSSNCCVRHARFPKSRRS
jgi:hypothetical protein